MWKIVVTALLSSVLTAFALGVVLAGQPAIAQQRLQQQIILADMDGRERITLTATGTGAHILLKDSAGLIRGGLILTDEDGSAVILLTQEDGKRVWLP